MMSPITLVECPRDAMQGWQHFIPTQQKIDYLNQLLKVGFQVLDFGSFVSPKAIPQLIDTATVLSALDLSTTKTELLAIVANIRGAEEAVKYSAIKYLGFPFSISETFQKRNTHKSIAASLEHVKVIQQLAKDNGKKLVIYISMAFGNPYGDPYSPQLAIDWVQQIVDLGIEVIAMSDTIGVANRADIQNIFSSLLPAFPQIEIGAHFHAHPNARIEKIQAAYEVGCTRFDSSIQGIGGCPMAKDKLVGNIATETVIQFFESKGVLPQLDMEAFGKAVKMATEVFKS